MPCCPSSRESEVVEDVIDPAELAAISDRYKYIANFSLGALGD